MKQKEEIVKVVWLDAQRLELGCIQEEELLDLQPIEGTIVGFKVHEDEERIVIAQERWDLGGCKYVHVIPKISILRIIKLIGLDEVFDKLKMPQDKESKKIQKLIMESSK